MEIRRIEGIIPVEAVSKDLPFKLENFSYHDMKKLLSTITSGQSKKDLGEDLQSTLIRAVFEGFTPEGKAKLRVGDLLLIADVEVDREFSIGEELLFRLKSIYPRIELSFVKKEEILSSFISKLRLVLPSFSSEKLLLLGEILKKPEVMNALYTYISVHYQELLEEFKQFSESFKSGILSKLLSPYSIFVALLLLEDELYQEVKEKLPQSITQKDIKDAINTLISIHSLFILGSIIAFPIFFTDNFKGNVYIGLAEDESDPHSVFIELKTKLGTLGIFIMLLNESIMLEIVAENKELLDLFKTNLNELKTFFKEEGFNLVSVVFREGKRSLEEKRKKLFQNLETGFTIDFSV
ncbi:flagellar hook-length control protein FliK [Desulfurobacterium thermolithotrophum]|uniref:flagellar hook-length control protein FliK n=1 Tax=Desulfurobacterium thermolithotrophum TaxID=64160 RepID=UPI0013D86B9B|nr:flagellar hook-length control protein FliK [Desulfurobacterium thermolithotrophum]